MGLFKSMVVLKEYRGHGVGVSFFQAREEMARAQGSMKFIAFCAIDRAADHPAKPSDYHSPENIWLKHGFVKHPEITTQFSWKELNHSEKTTHKMIFWIKEI